ncbi:MAG: adenylate/guanylate cyclase domain-containing protein, partial [Verrucomicrobiales bacterium]
RPLRLGRSPRVDPEPAEDAFVIPWPDRIVNRDHSTARRDGESLIVERIPCDGGERGSPPNPFYTNAPAENRVRIEDPLRLEPGDSFVIGARGRTTFFWLRELGDLERLMDSDDGAGPGRREFQKSPEATEDYGQVAELDEYSMRLQLKLLQQELPEKVLRGWTDDVDLNTRASDFLQSALPGQKGVSVSFIALCTENEDEPYQILHANTSSRADFRPSRTLVRQILADGLAPDRTHIWNTNEHYADLSGGSFVGQVDWIVALPLSALESDAPLYHDARGRPIYLYVETRQASNASARVFVPFLRLISSIVSSLLSSREKQRIQDQMSAYFSPALRKHLREGDEEALALTMAECTVLFCDRRASSRGMEQAKSDEEILEMLRDNQEFVSEIIQIVFDHDGVITDFAGDGVLALWGWPRSSGTSANHALQAVETAESIAERLADRLELGNGSRSGLAAFRVGVSTGRIAVGKTGPAQQMHISCFGSVVNFGSRLEGLGKQFRVPALLSGDTAAVVRDQGILLRELCYLKPAGFDNAYPIFELVLPSEQGGSGASPEDVSIYENALRKFLARDWKGARTLLDTLPPRDAPAHWLARQAVYFSEHEPPEDWAGEIAILAK